MKKTIGFLGCAVVLLAGCADTTSVDPNTQFITEVPESVSTIAAAGQDLTAVRVDPIDGCYVYRHRGPVETTLIPLRAKNGRPICTRAL